MSEDKTGRALAHRAEAAARRRALSAGMLTVASIVFVALELRLIRSRGPIRWRAPETVVSNGHPAQRLSDPLLRVLRDASEVLPPGASVAVLGPNAGTPWAVMDDLLALGQLPHNEVVPGQTVLDGRSAPPRFLLTDHPVAADDRYRLLVSLGKGGLFERKH